MMYAGRMRRWARRVATRRISWTDQRTRAGVPVAATTAFLGVMPGSRGGAPSPKAIPRSDVAEGRQAPAWRRRARRARYNGANRATSGSRCDRRTGGSPDLAEFGLRRFEGVLDGPALPSDRDQLLHAGPGRTPRAEASRRRDDEPRTRPGRARVRRLWRHDRPRIERMAAPPRPSPSTARRGPWVSERSASTSPSAATTSPASSTTDARTGSRSASGRRPTASAARSPGHVAGPRRTPRSRR